VLPTLSPAMLTVLLPVLFSVSPCCQPHCHLSTLHCWSTWPDPCLVQFYILLPHPFASRVIASITVALLAVYWQRLPALSQILFPVSNPFFIQIKGNMYFPHLLIRDFLKIVNSNFDC
jgi:hypothetical protein